MAAANDIPVKERVRLYVDESGTHARPKKDVFGERYLGLVGVAMRRDETYTALHDAFRTLKHEHLGIDPDERVTLHAEDIHAARGPFVALKEASRRAAFDDDFLEIARGARFRAFAVVIDKQSHFNKTYRKLQHPYHYAVNVLLERYGYWMNSIRAVGDVMFEARGKRENAELESAFRDVMERGTYYASKELLQSRITSLNPKLATKPDMIAGLELSDMLARTATRDVVRVKGRVDVPPSPYETRIGELLAGKYITDSRTGQVFGRVLLR